MIGEDIDFGYDEVRFVDAVGAVDYELLGGQQFDEGADLGGPAVWDPLVSEKRAAQFVASLIREYGWIFRLGYISLCSLGLGENASGVD